MNKDEKLSDGLGTRLRMSKIVLFILCAPILLINFTFAQDNSFGVKSAMYGSKAFTEEQYVFTPYDTFYIVLDLSNLNPGEHLITTDWIDPWGRLERQSIYRFSLEEPLKFYRVYSWLQLWKKGFVSRAFIGKDYNDKFYGEWSVKIYLNGTRIAERKFKVV